jgi:hypothetical protein
MYKVPGAAPKATAKNRYNSSSLTGLFALEVTEVGNRRTSSSVSAPPHAVSIRTVSRLTSEYLLIMLAFSSVKNRRYLGIFKKSEVL